MEALTLDALTDGMADFLEYFGRCLEEGPAREVSQGFISTLRYAFDPSGPRQAEQ